MQSIRILRLFRIHADAVDPSIGSSRTGWIRLDPLLPLTRVSRHPPANFLLNFCPRDPQIFEKFLGSSSSSRDISSRTESASAIFPRGGAQKISRSRARVPGVSASLVTTGGGRQLQGGSREFTVQVHEHGNTRETRGRRETARRTKAEARHQSGYQGSFAAHR